MCFITKEGIPHTWDIPSLFKSMLIILIANNECSLFRKGISICKLASNEWTVAYSSYFNFIVSFNTVNVLMYAFLTWIFRKRKYSPYAETEYWHELLLLVEKQILKKQADHMERTFLIDARFKESNFFFKSNGQNV